MSFAEIQSKANAQWKELWEGDKPLILVGMAICARACPVDAITGGKRMVHVIDQEKCIKCGTCLEKCPPKFDAVTKVSAQTIEVPSDPVPIGAGAD
jgi:Na+-translocating ferredoxin:NAD+ oxidoreductase RNF subunit RnfB